LRRQPVEFLISKRTRRIDQFGEQDAALQSAMGCPSFIAVRKIILAAAIREDCLHDDVGLPGIAGRDAGAAISACRS